MGFISNFLRIFRKVNRSTKRAKKIKDHVSDNRKRVEDRETASGTCGTYGGVNSDGDPCERSAGWGTDSDEGRCKHHKDQTEAEVRSRKSKGKPDFGGAAIELTRLIREWI